MFCVTKWCKSITVSGKDEPTNNLSKMKEYLKMKFGKIPTIYSYRLLDDDGVIYAYGKSTNDSSFAPLDRYQSDYGCTEIQYKNPETGKYETL